MNQAKVDPLAQGVSVLAGSDSENIFNVRVDCVSRSKLLALVMAWAGQGRPRTVLYVNAHCLNVSFTDPDHREILNQADLVYSDGIGVVWASRLLGGCRLQKITGRDWIARFSQIAAEQEMRIYILAGRPGVAGKAAANLSRRWPALQIVGAQDGFFLEQDERETLADIAAARPHVLLVGMNTPRQEKWIARHRAQIPAPVCWAVGALFDYVAGAEPPVPTWMNALALEWLWRLLMDPAGKWRRYLLGNPVFVYRLLRQRLRAG